MSTLAREYLTGSLASSLTYTLFSPLEVVKTQMQLQSTVGVQHARLPASFAHALANGLTADGPLHFWSHGLCAGIARDFFYSGFRTGMYPSVRNAISGAGGDASMLQKITAGAMTGSLGAGLANTFDVVRVRMIAEGGRVDPNTGILTTGLRAGHPPRWPSSLQCAADTAQREGVIHGLMLRGVGASMSRAALLTAAQMSTYDHAKTLAKRNGFGESTQLHVAAALLSGLVATIACNPADVVKSRVMSARASGAGSGDGGGTLGVLARIAQHDGIAGFYRGFLPAYARIGPTSALQPRPPAQEPLRAPGPLSLTHSLALRMRCALVCCRSPDPASRRGGASASLWSPAAVVCDLGPCDPREAREAAFSPSTFRRLSTVFTHSHSSKSNRDEIRCNR